MNSSRVVLIVILLLGFMGCATVPVPMTGRTTASTQLKKDAFGILSVAFQMKTNCQQIDAVETEVLSIAPDLRVNDSGVAIQGRVEERWVAIGCGGKRVPLDFRFSPDGEGGTYIGFTL